MPSCLGLIEDQGDCGSCWAFTSAGLLSDRFCIHTKGAIDVRLSPQEMVNCNYENYGCLGGYLITSVDYLMVEGAVSNTCVPYEESSGFCTYRCSDGGKTSYDKYYCKPGTLAIAVTHDEIKRELVNNGPMLMGLQIKATTFHLMLVNNSIVIMMVSGTTPIAFRKTPRNSAIMTKMV